MAELASHTATKLRLKVLDDAIESGRLERVRRLMNSLPAAEIGHLLESVPPPKRLVMWEAVDPEDEGEVLVHVNDEVRSGLIAQMDDAALVAATSDLDLDDLADILDDLPHTVTQQILTSMDRENRERLHQVLSYPEDSAGGLVNPDVITVRADVTLDVVLRYLRVRGELPDLMDDLFVVDRDGHYLGRLSLSDLLTQDPAKAVAELTDNSELAIHVDQSAGEVATDFEHHDWVSAPVVDSNNVLVGRITIDDVVDVIRDEAEHSVLSMAGLDEEDDMFAPVGLSLRRRAVWLGINLLTALLAAWFIGRFEVALETVVALAILMPVVASMGGIAGTQTLTLMIRGMAVGQVDVGNRKALLYRELSVGVLNGLLWAGVLAFIAWLWFGSTHLGGVIAIAILINLIAAALSGVAIPLVLRKLDIDPALAGGVVLTTVTDVVGFVSFLGLGTLLLI